ncbi:hypothetical protein H2199_008886 [Coniosporium tulheliwenetii]|uniref:Uncharacterized protein n=1 Tax=Coniosporium tulheliwenetii TaxID=3383036 RepID=A0ACC2YH95_9PEZI|nr:hypothetical protein H2199_008886 [Cladosporium sp. JES 115]
MGIMHPLATVQADLDDLAAAESTYRTLLSHQDAAYGPGTSYAVLNNLSHILNKRGKFAEAEELLRVLYPRLAGLMGRYNPKTLGSLRGIIEAVGRQGRWEER